MIAINRQHKVYPFDSTAFVHVLKSIFFGGWVSRNTQEVPINIGILRENKDVSRLLTRTYEFLTQFEAIFAIF